MNTPSRDVVLVVDDEQALRLVLQKMLEDEGVGVLTAADGTDARVILEANPESISAVVLDWLMPAMTGIELLRWMKTQPNIEHIPVIMLTALADPERIREGIDAGAFYYLVKPFEKTLLNSILRAAVFDFHSTRHLLEKLRHYEKPISFLEEGTFRFRTLEEAEHVS